MPSLHSAPDRHVAIDRRPGHYLCFPDVCLAADGTLLCAYNEFDRHVGTRRRLLLRESSDGGRTWGERRILRADESHCPRLSRLSDGLLCLIDDAGPALFWSADDGKSWAQQPGGGLGHGLQDRALELNFEMLFTTGHMHRGQQPQPKIRQAPTEQMAYLSRNRGRTWQLTSIVASEKCLVLCEGSAIRLPGLGPTGMPRILVLMRENSFVGEPMYYAISDDGGATWGEPAPTPLIGHRPTLGWTASGSLLVTYRDVGPDPGTKAWLGSLDELCGADFAVHGLHPAQGNPRLTRDGLLVKSSGGIEEAVRYCLRPITDPEFAQVDFEAEVLVRHAEANGCGIRLGAWWKLYPDRIEPDLEGAKPIRWAKGRAHRVRIVYDSGLCRLFVDGKAKGEYPVDRMSGETRPILVGAVARKTDNACEALWKSLRLDIREPRLGREYAWAWSHRDKALPDAWADARVLELQNDRQASPADFGYSGWVELAPGRFFCAYHHGGGDAPDYREGFSAHIAGTWFGEEDFGGGE